MRATIPNSFVAMVAGKPTVFLNSAESVTQTLKKLLL